jgi:hypothetical protein
MEIFIFYIICICKNPINSLEEREFLDYSPEAAFMGKIVPGLVGYLLFDL